MTNAKELKHIKPKLCPIPNIEPDRFYAFPLLLRRLAVLIYHSEPIIDDNTGKLNIAHYCKLLDVSYNTVTKAIQREKKKDNDFRELMADVYMENLKDTVPALLEAAKKLGVKATREGFPDRQMLLKLMDIIKPDNAPTVNIEHMMITRYASISTQKPLEPEDVIQIMPTMKAKVVDARLKSVENQVNLVKNGNGGAKENP